MLTLNSMCVVLYFPVSLFFPYLKNMLMVCWCTPEGGGGGAWSGFHRPTSQSSTVSVATDWRFKLWEARAGFPCQPQLRSCGVLMKHAPVCPKVWTITLICRIHCLLPLSLRDSRPFGPDINTSAFSTLSPSCSAASVVVLTQQCKIHYINGLFQKPKLIRSRGVILKWTVQQLLLSWYTAVIRES